MVTFLLGFTFFPYWVIISSLKEIHFYFRLIMTMKEIHFYFRLLMTVKELLEIVCTELTPRLSPASNTSIGISQRIS